LDDLTLARCLAAKDERAACLLVERHHVAIYRFLRQMTRRTADAEDLTQQTLLRILAGAARFDGRTTLRAWALGIAFREFTKWRRRKPWLPLLAEQRETSDPYSDVDNAFVLLTALQRLPSADRALFLMHYVEELNVAEIARALAIPEGTVKSRLHAVRVRLRTYLGEEETPYVAETC
jgi:RNA polymerase sigma-70 factor, ECF subfamily